MGLMLMKSNIHRDCYKVLISCPIPLNTARFLLISKQDLQ